MLEAIENRMLATVHIQKIPLVFCALSVVSLCRATGQGSTEATPDRDSSADLPGYYEFFMKAGKLSQLDAEADRDERIQAGELPPVYGNEPVPDLRLPDGFGQWHGTRDQVGKRNLVLITGRAWW